MRKPAAILFLVLLTFTVLGYQLVFYVMAREAKSSMRDYLRTARASEVGTLHLSKAQASQIDWQEDGREFSWHGALFDVVSKTTNTDSVHIRCISDRDETNLLLAFLDGIKKQSAKNHSVGKMLALQFIAHNGTAEPLCVTSLLVDFPVTRDEVPTRPHPIEVPPPKAVLLLAA
ncbi:MAG: hypothetical protein JWP27_2152 [Flaviaesturariibacter sp.]|nr:hypothetical protein [Flaviaesturariibacter sp.]